MLLFVVEIIIIFFYVSTTPLYFNSLYISNYYLYMHDDVSYETI